jgi:hypothetical protein
MKAGILIIALLAVSFFVSAQKPTVVKGKVFDLETGQPISDVNISIKSTSLGTTTDKTGTYTLTLRSAKDTIVYSHVQYVSLEKQYTGTNLKADVLLEPLVNMLPVATVKPVVNISKGMLLDVTDYCFIGDSILYSGFCYRYNKKQNPWLVMIAPNGDTVFSYCTGVEGEFWQDCLGNTHYLTEKTAYQIVFGKNSVSLEYPTDIDEFLSVMESCKFESNGKLLFSTFSDRNQILVYYLADTTSYETEIFRTIADEVKLNMLAFEGMFFSMGAPPNDHDLRFEQMMYEPVFAPIIKTDDTIAIINYTDSRIELYDTLFKEIGTKDIYFQNSKYCEDEIAADADGGRVFAVFEKNGKVSVKEIFLNSGATGEELAIPDFLWIDNIKVHNDKLYFLYREKYSGELRALYRMFLD